MSEISWASAMYGGALNDTVPYCHGVVLAFRDTCNGPITGYGTINATYSRLFQAYATILKYGFNGLEDKSAAFGLGSSQSDQVARYYATNMAMQRLAGQSLSGSDIGTYSTSGVTDLRVTNFSYYLENKARKVLCGKDEIFANLDGSIGTPYRYSSTYTVVPVTVSVPSSEALNYYSNSTDFTWADLSGLSCPNANSVKSTMSNFRNARSVSANLQIASSSIKGGERIAFYIQGKVRSPQTNARMFMSGDPTREVFMIGDPSSTGTEYLYESLNRILVSATLPKFDVISSTITPSATSFNAGATGTVKVRYKNNSSLPAVNVPVSLSCSSSLGTPFTITTPTKTISEIQPGKTVSVTWNVKANTLSGNATAKFTSKIGYQTNGTKRFNETNYSNNTSTKSVTVKSLPDLQVTSLKTDKSTYDAGDTVTFTAVIKNTGSASCGANSRTTISYNTNYLTPTDQRYVVTANLKAGQSTTIKFYAKANTLTNSISTNATVTADSTGAITELHENNNTRSVNVHINEAYPDYVVDSVLCDKEPNSIYEAGDTITITATVTNIGDLAGKGESIVRLSQLEPDSMQPVGFDQGTQPAANGTYDTTIGALDVNASTTVSWSFVTPIRIEVRTVNATVTADATNLITESDENNNTQTIYLTLNPGKPDFSVEVYNIEDGESYIAGYDANIAAVINNDGKISSPSVDIEMTIAGEKYTDNICVPTAERNYPTGSHPDGCNLSSFRFHIPETPGAYQVKITADPDNAIDEEDESNNTISFMIQVGAEKVVTLVDAFDDSIKKDYIRNGVLNYTDSPEISWQEIRHTGEKTYDSVTYYARLTNDFTLSPGKYAAYPEPVRADTIESGFGLEGNSVLTLESNYDKPEKLVGPQYLYVYYPETNYGDNSSASGFEDYHETMDFISGSEYNGVWALEKNPFSTLDYPRIHYTPLWYPDGEYSAICMAWGGWTPAGKLTNGAEDSVIISGDMYDRVSVVAK